MYFFFLFTASWAATRHLLRGPNAGCLACLTEPHIFPALALPLHTLLPSLQTPPGSASCWQNTLNRSRRKRRKERKRRRREMRGQRRKRGGGSGSAAAHIETSVCAAEQRRRQGVRLLGPAASRACMQLGTSRRLQPSCKASRLLGRRRCRWGSVRRRQAVRQMRRLAAAAARS